MHEDVKAAWVAALRSGEYEQTTAALAEADPETGEPTGFCCLGVLCEVGLKAGLNISVTTGKNEYRAVDVRRYDGEGDVLPESVTRWAGLSTRNPTITFTRDMIDRSEGNSMGTLVELNDDFEMTFEEIADLIEEQL